VLGEGAAERVETFVATSPIDGDSKTDRCPPAKRLWVARSESWFGGIFGK
jgi:hypothetical protein